MTETITYMAQLVPPFERASEAIKKLLKIEVSAKQIQIISEEVGKECRLYILTDGSQVNTRIGDENGITRKEMKLGLIFCDKDVIKRSDGGHIIIKKDASDIFYAPVLVIILIKIICLV